MTERLSTPQPRWLPVLSACLVLMWWAILLVEMVDGLVNKTSAAHVRTLLFLVLFEVIRSRPMARKWELSFAWTRTVLLVTTIIGMWFVASPMEIRFIWFLRLVPARVAYIVLIPYLILGLRGLYVLMQPVDTRDSLDSRGRK